MATLAIDTRDLVTSLHNKLHEVISKASNEAFENFLAETKRQFRGQALYSLFLVGSGDYKDYRTTCDSFAKILAFIRKTEIPLCVPRRLRSQAFVKVEDLEELGPPTAREPRRIHIDFGSVDSKSGFLIIRGNIRQVIDQVREAEKIKREGSTGQTRRCCGEGEQR